MTLYVPATVTVIDEVVAPVLHNNEPVKPEAVNKELPQLLVTDTIGAPGMGLTVKVAGFEFTEPPLLVHTARYCLLLSPVVTAKVKVLFVAPLMFVQLVPFVLDCHCTEGAGLPLAAELKLTLLPAHFVCETGCVVTDGAVAPLFASKTTSTQ